MKLSLYLGVFVIITRNVFCASPTISGVPTAVNMGEQEYKRRPIYTIQATDVNNDHFTCNVFSVTPAPSNKNVSFNVLIDKSYGSYVVYAENADPGTDAAPNPMFDYNFEQTFQVVFKCNDSQNHASFGRLEVDLIDNDRITLVNLPDSVIKDASAIKTNDIVYSVSATQLSTTNDDGLTYTMKTSPTSNSFTIDGFGNIRAKQDLNRENSSPITAFVTVSDGNMWVEQTLKITLINMNDIPEITNMLTPQDIYLPESTASGTTIIQLTGLDADADTLNYAISVDPLTDVFEIVSTTSPPSVRIKTDKTLDYESVQYYNLTATVTDGKATGGPYVLNIHVQNVNEPCTFDRSLYTLTTDEGPAGSILGNPGFIVTDGDGPNQAYTLSLTNINNGNRTDRLIMNSTTGLISYATEYDIDNSAMISTIYAGVRCTDIAGNTGTATLIIYVQDMNDNSPGCTNEYTYYTNQNTVVGTALGTPAVTDIDSGVNGQFECSYGTTQNRVTATNNYVVGSDCLVSFNTVDGLVNNAPIRFTVQATDKGTPPRTGTCFVNVIYIETTTTTTPTTTTSTTTTTTTTVAPDTGLSDGSLAAIIIGALVGAALLGILLYMLFRWCFTGFCCGPDPCDFAGCCRRGNYSNYPRRQITPVRSIRDKPYDRHSRNTADEFNYYRDDSHLGSIKEYDIRNSRHSRPDRIYPDWPQTGEAQFPRLSPSDARVEMISAPYSKGPLPIRY